MANRDHVVIIMGLYNGAPFVDEQLASIAAQDHQNWTLIVSDDGSTDTGPDQVRRFADGAGKGRVTFVQGPGRGFAQNFLSLLRHPAASAADYVAISDQDDKWLPIRLSRGIAALHPQGDRPALCCARTVVCDATLGPLHISPLWPRPFALRNALVQNVASGNTILLNRTMARVAADAAPAAQAANIAAHDWWLYQLASASGAHVVQDDCPVLHYRQHGANSMGRNDTLSARMGRVAQVLDSTFARWIDANCLALSSVPQFLTPDAGALLSQMPSLRAASSGARLRALQDTGLYRQGKAGDLALWAAAALGKL